MTEIQRPTQNEGALYFAQQYIKPESRVDKNNRLDNTVYQVAVTQNKKHGNLSTYIFDNMFNRDMPFGTVVIYPSDVLRRVYAGLNSSTALSLQSRIDKKMVPVLLGDEYKAMSERHDLERDKLYNEEQYAKPERLAEIIAQGAQRYEVADSLLKQLEEISTRANEPIIRSLDEELIIPDALGKGRTLVEVVGEEDSGIEGVLWKIA